MRVVQVWDRRRCATLAAVFALHAALLSALWLFPPNLPVAGATPRPLELLSLPPSPISTIRPDNFRPHRIGNDLAITIAPPVIGSLAMAPSTSGSEGNGTGVDWGAEARRALQAYEIRNNKRPTGPAPSASSAEDGWWPQTQHHAGEQYKTEAGDWIVWINANCYQVAKAATSYALGTVLPQTICPRDAAPHGDRDSGSPTDSATHPQG
jgi:hypothetical protein